MRGGRRQTRGRKEVMFDEIRGGECTNCIIAGVDWVGAWGEGEGKR